VHLNRVIGGGPTAEDHVGNDYGDTDSDGDNSDNGESERPVPYAKLYGYRNCDYGGIDDDDDNDEDADEDHARTTRQYVYGYKYKSHGDDEGEDSGSDDGDDDDDAEPVSQAPMQGRPAIAGRIFSPMTSTNLW
jgi:hypothetical protein